jgi:hypothetical protein
MSETKPVPVFDAERHLDAMAPALGLTISAEHRPGVVQFLATAHVMFQVVKTAPIEDGSFELAPSFRPGRTGSDA